jgi:acyl-CoA thioesterase II
MAASFQIPEAGLEHQIEPPDVPPPEGLPDEEELRRRIADRIPAKYRDHFLRKRPIEIRPVDGEGFFSGKVRPPHYAVWMRAAGALPDDTALQQCVLAYASDMTLLETSLAPHGVSWFDEKIQLATIDHAMWFHRPFRADKWLLYVQDSPSLRSSRVQPRSRLFARGRTRGFRGAGRAHQDQRQIKRGRRIVRGWIVDNAGHLPADRHVQSAGQANPSNPAPSCSLAGLRPQSLNFSTN